MKKSLYFSSVEEMNNYFPDGVPSGFLAIVQPDSKTEASLYTSSNNSPVNPGQSEEQGGDAAPDSPWIETEDLALILNDPKSLELPLHIDAVSTCISSSFDTIKDSEENITSAEYIYEVDTGNGVTVIVKVIVHDNENGDLENCIDLEDSLNDYGDDIYNNIYPTLTDCTLSIYEEGGKNTRSMAPQYVLEGKIYAWNLGDNITGVQDITENGFYLNTNEAVGFNVDVEGGGSNTISSVSVYDEGSEIGTYLTAEDIDGVDYFTYEFRMDTTTYTSKNFVVECTVGEDNYYLSQGVYISDPGDNGEYFTENHQVLNSWSGSIYNQLGSDWTGDQPNAYVDVKLYLKSIQDVSGWYTGFEYEVSGYEKQDTVTIYSYNDGTGDYDIEMNTLYLNSILGNFESDGPAMVVGNVRFYHSTYGWLNPQSNEVIANSDGQVIVDDLSSSESGHFEFDLWNYDLSISISDGQADPPTFELTVTPDEDTTFNVVVNDSVVGMISLNQTINQNTTQGDIIQFEMLGGTVSFDTNSDPQLNGNTLSVVLDTQGTGSQTYNSVTADGGNYNISLVENNSELSVVFTPYR